MGLRQQGRGVFTEFAKYCTINEICGSCWYD